MHIKANVLGGTSSFGRKTTCLLPVCPCRIKKNPGLKWRTMSAKTKERSSSSDGGFESIQERATEEQFWVSIMRLSVVILLSRCLKSEQKQ